MCINDVRVNQNLFPFDTMIETLFLRLSCAKTIQIRSQYLLASPTGAKWDTRLLFNTGHHNRIMRIKTFSMLLLGITITFFIS